jgi:hypothetical protein
MMRNWFQLLVCLICISQVALANDSLRAKADSSEAKWVCFFNAIEEQLALPNAKDYGTISFRSLLGVDDAHEDLITADLKSLPEGSVILDPGAGYALSDVELANRGFRVIAINAQDFPSLYKELRNPDHIELERVPTSPSFYQRVNGIPTTLLKRMSETFGISIPPDLHFQRTGSVNLHGEYTQEWLKHEDGVNDSDLMKSISNWATQIEAAWESLLKKGKLSYQTAWVQDALPAIPDNSVNRIYETYGGFYYIPNRLKLLRDYWAKLSPGGKAFINIANIQDVVHDPAFAEPMSLGRWLAKKYPTVFLDPSGGQIQIVMTKSQKEFPLSVDLRQKYEGTQKVGGKNGVVIPVMSYRLDN